MASTSQVINRREKKRQLDAKDRQILVDSSKVFIKQSRDFIFSEQNLLDINSRERYFKEILHSIFFIGYIYSDPIHPNEILSEEDYLNLSGKYPDVFQWYKSQLPRRPPYSVLLEVVVETTVGRDDSAVLGVLAKLSDEMIIHRSEGKSCENDFLLGASVVSYSYFERNQRTKNYFGASMSCKGKTATRIFINLACIETWNRNVARAVCLADKYNRSIKLPEAVYSKANSLCLSQEGENYSHKYIELSPCLLCQKIFPDVKFSPPPTGDPDKPSWNYGNCAECEAISNLLNGEPGVSEETEKLNTGLKPSLEELCKYRKELLRGHLNHCKVDINKGFIFYNP